MFSRTQNGNGRFSTRCLYCFLIIAAGLETPHEVDRVEATHICPEKALAELMAHEKSCQIQEENS